MCIECMRCNYDVAKDVGAELHTSLGGDANRGACSVDATRSYFRWVQLKEVRLRVRRSGAGGTLGCVSIRGLGMRGGDLQLLSISYPVLRF